LCSAPRFDQSSLIEQNAIEKNIIIYKESKLLVVYMYIKNTDL